MAKYIRQHRHHFAGVAIPVFFLFLIGAISFSVFPGWLKPSYGVPGTPCTINGSISFFSPDCDICNGELCVIPTDFAPQGVTGQCGVAIFSNGVPSSFDFSSTASSPQCPDGAIAAAVHPFLDGTANSGEATFPYPGCWDQCVATNLTVTSNTTTFSAVVPVCQPNTTFCQIISGGDASNECRIGECTSSSTPDPTNNPSGCDYEPIAVTQNEDCQLCTDAVEAGIPACGNGVCERDESEDCDTCPIDCMIPGFEFSCPLTSGQTIVDSCTPLGPTGPAGVVFDGPPYNDEGSQMCEDGDLCTDNACGPNNDTCLATDKSCDAVNSDFCCPAGCDASNDADCYVPQECLAPPIGSPELSGTCIGSLIPNVRSTTTRAWALLLLVALAFPALLKRRQNY